jgi:hypothetical protein
MSNGFKINRTEIAKMTKELQREFDKHPIQVPVQPSTRRATAAPAAVVHHHGTTVNITGDGAQVAWGNSGPVTQNRVEAVAPGLEAIAELLATVLGNAGAYGLGSDDEAELRQAAEDALAETTGEAPDVHKLRRSVTFIKGLLAPVVAGVSAGVTHESTELARHTISALTSAFAS